MGTVKADSISLIVLRILGLILLVASLLLIAGSLARYGTATLRGGQNNAAPATGVDHEALTTASAALARTVKFIVIPGALLLLGGVLLRSSRRDGRIHQLSVETEPD